MSLILKFCSILTSCSFFILFHFREEKKNLKCLIRNAAVSDLNKTFTIEACEHSDVFLNAAQKQPSTAQLGVEGKSLERKRFYSAIHERKKNRISNSASTLSIFGPSFCEFYNWKQCKSSIRIIKSGSSYITAVLRLLAVIFSTSRNCTLIF